MMPISTIKTLFFKSTRCLALIISLIAYCFLTLSTLSQEKKQIKEKDCKITNAQNFDNSNPRQWLAQQTGFRARANAAQANTFESIPFFFAAIAIAAITQAPQERIDFLAVIYVLARIAFIVCYVADWPKLRTAVWTIALAAIIAIFFQI